MVLESIDVRPKFEFFPRVLSSDTREKIMNGLTLGPDPTSEHFTERSKAIRFVTVINGKVQSFAQDYFKQDSAYNDFSGGYRRRYALIPEDICESALKDILLNFTSYYQIPEKTVLLVQIQTSHFQKNGRRGSVTGQGIHTDGSDRAMLVCLHRGCNVTGALNQFHGALDGSQPLCEPTELKPGGAVMFKDNELYHYVSPGKAAHAAESLRTDAQRTVLLVHSPAEMFMQGLPNTSNDLGTKAGKVKLREQSGVETE